VMAKTNLGVAMMRSGRAAEAAPLFNELLAREGLEEPTLLNIGIGLYRANQYEQAARAFERAMSVNPYSHDAIYNLAQSILGATAALEKTKADKPAAEVAAIDEQLVKAYTRMGEVAEKLLQINPVNTQAVMLLAQSQRARGELTADKVKAEDWKKAVLATLQLHETWTFEVESVLVRWGADRAIITGGIRNLKAAQDAPLKINFSLLDVAGTPLGTQEISVNAPATGESKRFTIEMPTTDATVAWKYEVLK